MAILKLRGLDDFTKEELNKYWEGYNPKVDKPRILGVSLSCSNRYNLKCIYCYAGTEKNPIIMN